MKKPNAPESPTERKFNFGVLVAVRIAALALGVLAVAGVAIKGVNYDQAFPMLMVAFVLLCLADLQDTFALNRVMKFLENRQQNDPPDNNNGENNGRQE
jgi:cell division protein FtsW (lipid II flippase)